MLYEFKWRGQWCILGTEELEEFLEEKTHIKCIIPEPGTMILLTSIPIETNFGFTIKYNYPHIRSRRPKSSAVTIHDDLYDIILFALKSPRRDGRWIKRKK